MRDLDRFQVYCTPPVSCTFTSNDLIFKACVRYFLKSQDTSSLLTEMKLQLQPMFISMSIPGEKKLFLPCFMLSLHLQLEVKQGH